ncbi:hypothetical protein EV424DRAFT_1475282 [Suillus variegatus]|nr:hypothetical protein EV424DRAFT_1475282 [Suillus variegatus]
MSAIPLASAVNTILQLMLANEVSLWDLTKMVLSTPRPNYQPIKDSLQQHAVDICWLLFSSVGCHEIVFSWALEIEGVHKDKEMDLGKFGGDDSAVINESDSNKRRHENDEGKAQKQQRRAGERNAALMIIKTVICACIFAQNSNERCNTLQCIFGIFLHSSGMLQRVIDVLAHAGFSISTQSITTAVKSLSKEAGVQIKRAVQTLTTALAYDNFDINFKTAQPTIEHQSQFVSSTSATAIPLYGVDDPADLHIFHQEHSYGMALPGQQRSPRKENFAWHVRDILLNHGEHFDFLKHQNGNPAIVNAIPLHKTTQIPCQAMPIKQSTTNGNIEVMDSLLRQGRIGECKDINFDPQYNVDMSEHVLLVHGDLLTKEWLDAIVKSQRIEDTPKCCFQHIVFIPGLFHFKMEIRVKTGLSKDA